MALSVLIADDETLECDALEFFAKNSDPECVCTKVKNGREAVEQARSLRPQLIFLDIQMPVLTGLEAAEEIRTFLPDADIVFVTAWGRFDFAQKALRLHATDYIVKPVDQEAVSKVFDKFRTRINAEKKAETDLFESAAVQKASEHLTEKIISGYEIPVRNAVQKFLETFYKVYGKTDESLEEFEARLNSVHFAVSREVPFLETPEFRNGTFADYESRLASYADSACKAAAMDHQDKYLRIFGLIKKYISTHFSEQITTETICEIFSLHTGYFPQLFKKYCGKTFVEYLTDVRMNKAAEAVKNGMTVKQAALECGIADTNYFSKVFKKYFGTSPVEFKKSGDQ